MVEMKQFEVKPGVVLPAVKVDGVIVMNDGTVRIQYLEKVEEKPSVLMVEETEKTTFKTVDFGPNPRAEKSGGKKEK